MNRHSFTEDEIVLCTYAAQFDKADLGGIKAICDVTGRSSGSVALKIRNIVAMLDEIGIDRRSSESPLNGCPPGMVGRRTNLDVVEPLTKLPRQAFLAKCDAILRRCSVG